MLDISMIIHEAKLL